MLDKPPGAPNYWCTWAAQNYMYGHNLANLDPAILEGESGNKLAHEAMTEKVLFGEGGWVNSIFTDIRKDLYLSSQMMDGKLEAQLHSSWMPSNFLTLPGHLKAVFEN